MRKIQQLLTQLWNENGNRHQITLTVLQLMHQSIQFSGAQFFHLNFQVYISLITSLLGFATFSYQTENERRANKI